MTERAGDKGHYLLEGDVHYAELDGIPLPLQLQQDLKALREGADRDVVNDWSLGHRK